MLDIKKILKRRRLINIVYPSVWILVLLLFVIFSLAFYYNKKNKGDIPSGGDVKMDLPEITKPLSGDGSTENKEVVSKPPKYSNQGSSKKINTKAGTATIISDGSISSEDIDKLQEYANLGPVSNITYTDKTGRYPNLGENLKNYLYNTLLWSDADVSYMYEIELIDCSTCAYGGLYTGSYISNGSDITKAFGWIKLNISSYASSPYFEDYMKLILSHEYGHHYTLYHKWVDYNLFYGERFPSDYYSIRPLSYATTAVDYSLGWANCEAEIIAEDYSYLFSGYSYHAMSNTYGYPSSATRNWLYSLSGKTPAEVDSQAPTVSLTNPLDGAEVSGSVAISASSSDNVAVTKVEFYINSSLLYIASSAPYQANWNTLAYPNGSYTIIAKAFDSMQSSQSNITVVVNNAASEDYEKPEVSITLPVSNPYNWSSGNLNVSANASDNVGIFKIQFLINGTVVAEEPGSPINRIWQASGTPSGSYTLTAKAFDTSNNFKETSITVNKTF